MSIGDLISRVRSCALWPGLAASVAILLFLWISGAIGTGRAVFCLVAILLATWIGLILVRPHAEAAPVPPAYSPAADDDLLATIVAALPQPAFVLDRDGRVVAMNNQVRGIVPALRLGEPASVALRVPEVVDAIRHVSAEGMPERAEFLERAPAGRWLEAFVTPLRPGKRPGMLLLTFNDLSSVRRVEEMRADFVANASHELRTPLAALSGFIETLKGSARNDEAARERFLNIMESQAMRMARLIDDLLSLSRIELNAHLRPDKPVELLSVIRQVVDALQTLAKDRAVEVSITSPPEVLTVPGDRDELIRVFENLIENALKYGASGGKVDILLSKAKAADGSDEILVAVRDYGPGIAAEHLPRLTERFYRVDVAGSRAQGGTGLGLALVKHILNRHRGRLSIESKAGEGATFMVRLPLSSGQLPGQDRKL